MNENIKNIAEIIATAIVGDTADNEDSSSVAPIAEAGKIVIVKEEK